MSMIRESLIPTAFRQFAALIGNDAALAGIRDRTDLKAFFARLPWDEKAFKLKDDRLSTDTVDGASGNWLVRVCKDGPRLILAPTIHVFSKEVTVSGSQFWKQLTLAFDHGFNAFHPGPRGTRAEASQGDAARAGSPDQGFDRWNKSHFRKWTEHDGRPRRGDRADSDSGRTTAERQSYALFYQ